MGQIQLTAADGYTIGAYQVMPSGTPLGGVVVIQEIFGVNQHIRDVTDGYAHAGYAALAPQIFDRVEANVELGYSDETEFNKGLKLAFEDLNMEETLQDLQAAVNVATRHGNVGVVGYCFGGLLTWLCACEVDGIAAAAAYYGGGIAKELKRAVKCPVMMHFGARDTHIPMTDVEAIKEALPNVDVFVYDAEHGFNCDHRASYDKASAEKARERTLKFFQQHVSGR